MSVTVDFQTPKRSSYDVIIVGGAMYGSSVSWWLSDNADFNGTVLVVERNPTYENTSTTCTNSCIRQQFSNEINVQVSQFGAEFIKNFRSFMGNDDRVPDVVLQSYGYMYLADTAKFAQTLQEAQAVQKSLGSATKHMTRDEIARDYPFYMLDDIIGANHNLVDEGYFDGNTLFDWWKRSAKERGVEYLTNEVTGMTKNAAGTRIESVTLSTGETLACGTVVNCSGPRAVLTSRMAGIEVPVEPRKRYTFIDYDDFVQDHSIWEEKAWPTIANRIPQFEAIKLINSWAGHYAFNVLDQNAIIGPHTEVENFVFVNGFSGHGFQQSPAMGRGVAEWIAHGEYRTLDLSPFGYDRVAEGRKFLETAII